MGAAVRRRRRALELTLAVVSERSGLSVPFLSQIENDRARPSASSLERVADALRTTAMKLLAAADSACAVDVVRAEDGGVRRLVRGRHQISAPEFTGDHDVGRELQYRNDELMFVVEGAVDVEAEGQVHRLESGDTLFLSGGVRHRWRATVPATRLLVVSVAEHIDATFDSRR
ncbi:helix-turn-helix domain-containing protein [Streptomyces griseus]